MMEKMNRRSFLGASLLALCIPSKLFAEEESNNVVLRFAALSDVHYDKSHNDASAERVRFAKALQFMNEYSAAQPYPNFDALVVAGDFTNHGVIEEIGPFKKTMDDNLKPSTRRVLCMGNHEYYGGNRELWEKTFETQSYLRQAVNGYQFITVSPEKGTCNENDYVYLRDWLEQNIQEAIAADPTKPVFVVQHYHVFETVYGSASKPGDFHAGVKDFADVLNKYPQVVHISGHSHIPSYDPRAIWQGGFTAIGTGSMSYFALSLYEHARNFQLGTNVPFRQAGTFLIFEVHRDNTIRIRLYDVISNSFLDREYLLVDPINIDKYIYTNKRFEASNNPTWPQDAAAEALEVAPRGATIRFTQGVDEYCVVSYRIAVDIKKSDKWEPFKTYNVWSDFFMKEPTDSIEFDATELEPGNAYRFQIYATGAFQKETAVPITLELKTPDSKNVDSSQPNPRGDLLDVVFDPKDGPVASRGAQSQVKFIKIGDPEIVSDSSLGNAASFNGIDQCYLAPFSAIRTSGMGNAVSIGVKFRLDLSKYKSSDPISIFGSTESGGLGFEYYAKQKKLLARCWIDNKYCDASVPFDGQGDTTLFFTYDGKETRLYINGKLTSSSEQNGTFRFTQNASARAFAIGGDVCPNMGARWFFPGVISNVRVYSYALTPDQVANISKEK